MPRERVIHYNPVGETPEPTHKTRCGRRLILTRWAMQQNDVTCDRCLQLIKDAAK